MTTTLRSHHESASPADGQPPGSPEVVRCTDTADYLAALPRLLGFTPSNSLIITFFSGNRTGSSLRVDLPSNDRSDERAAYINELCSLLRRLRKQHGPLSPSIVVACSESFREARGAPWRSLVEALAKRLARTGDAARQLCCIASDGWADYRDASTPLLGRPLTEITDSPVAAPPLRGMEDIGSFVAATAHDQELVAQAIDAIVSRPQAESVTHSEQAEGARAALVREEPPSLDAFAEIITAVNTSAGWMAVFDQIASLAEGVISTHGPVSPTDAQRAATTRLKLVANRMVQCAGLAPRPLQPAVMALSAMTWWLHGMQTVAQRQIDAAYEVDSSNETVRMVERIISSEHYSPILPFLS